MKFDPKEPYADVLVSEIPPQSTILIMPRIQNVPQFDTALSDSDTDSEEEVSAPHASIAPRDINADHGAAYR